MGSVREETAVLGKFVDGLGLSVYGELDPLVREELDGCLRAAWNDGEAWQRAEIWYPALPGGTVRLRPSTRSGTRFSLDNECFHLEITTSPNISTPTLDLKFKVPYLYEHSLEELEAITATVAETFLVGDFEERVNRFDIAVDFQTKAWWSVPGEADVVCKPDTLIPRIKGSKNVGITVGVEKAPLRFQIYDKSREAKDTNKDWFFDLWEKEESYDPGETVYRAEFRFRRACLNQLRADGGDSGIRSISDLCNSLGDLMESVVGDGGKGSWIRFCAPETRGKRPDRRPPSDWWKTLALAFKDGMPVAGRVRRTRVSSSSHDQIRTMAVGLSTTLAAYMEHDGYTGVRESPEEFCKLLPQIIHEEMQRKNSTWEDRVTEKEDKLEAEGRIRRQATLGEAA